jgi:hypothetical protein
LLKQQTAAVTPHDTFRKLSWGRFFCFDSAMTTRHTPSAICM